MQPHLEASLADKENNTTNEYVPVALVVIMYSIVI